MQRKHYLQRNATTNNKRYVATSLTFQLQTKVSDKRTTLQVNHLHRAKHDILNCWEHVQQKSESSIVIAVRTIYGKAHTYISAHIVRMLNWSTASGISRYAINTGNYPWTKCHTRSPEISEWNTRTSISRSRMRIFCRNSDNTTHKSQWADAHWLKQNQWHNEMICHLDEHHYVKSTNAQTHQRLVVAPTDD